MDYEGRFHRLTYDLLNLLESHMLDWERAEKGGFDIDEATDYAEKNAGKQTEPVNYRKKTKKPPEENRLI